MNDQDQIIVLRQFENQIDAHIAKSKLDAYDIPCFLTGENFATLYPLQTFQSLGVRLHVFAKDEEHARQILNQMTAF